MAIRRQGAEKKRWRQLEHRCGAPSQFRRQLRHWYQGPLGQLAAQAETEVLEATLPNLFGYHLLQIGHWGAENYLSASRVQHKTVLDPDPAGAGVRGRVEALPVATDCIDVAVLPHTLEFSQNPHQVLREAERVLVPEGHVVILGFNPWSLWGLRRMTRRRQVPWCGQMISPHRLRDWLELLGFSICESEWVFYRPPLRKSGLMRRLAFVEKLGARWWPPLGGIYVMVAKKRVSTLTAIGPRWRRKRPVLSPGLVETRQ